MKPSRLVTQRLVLREFRRDDVEDVLGYASDERFGLYLEAVPYPYRRAGAEWFVNRDRGPHDWELAVTLGDRVIGAVSLRIDPGRRSAELGYALGVRAWGHGYATEAAGALVGHAIETERPAVVRATAAAGNEPSQRVLSKLGMQLEGVLRRRRFHRGEQMDVHAYSLMVEDWRR